MPGSLILGHVVAFREAKLKDTRFVKCFVHYDANAHIIRGVRKGSSYEVKVAAYNTSGEGPYTLPTVVKIDGI